MHKVNFKQFTIMLTISLVLSFLLTIYFAISKIQHHEISYVFLIAGVIFFLIFSFLAVAEIKSNAGIDLHVKIAWILGFLFLGILAGFIYLLIGRNTDSERRVSAP